MYSRETKDSFYDFYILQMTSEDKNKFNERPWAPAEGQQQQLKTTSDETSKFPWCCRASVLWSGKEALDVTSDDPPDEALSCRRRAWDVS